MNLMDKRIVFLTFLKRRDFLNYFVFESFKFFVTSQNIVVSEVSRNLKLVNKWKNTDTKL